MIIVSRLTKSFGSRYLFRDADLRLGARDRVALVGPNGSGKTTLLEMIVGLQSPDAGDIDVMRGATIGYLAQETDALRGRSVLEEVVKARTEVAQVEHRLDVLQREIDQCDDDAERAGLLDEYAHLQERFDSLGGWSVEVEAKRILAGLGFRDSDLERRTETLSGGWLMRVALAKLLLAAPDALLLDEPTNHLDLESVVWLEKFLKAYAGSVLVVSHDRDFINGVANKIVEIEDAKLVSYTGDYESFVEQRRQRLEQTQAAAKNQAKRVEQVQTFIDRFRYKASKARAVQSRIKMLDKMERIRAPKQSRRAMKVGFPPPPRPGRVVAQLHDIAFSYGPTRVYEHLNLELERGQKIALVGPNGAGKTTLLKLVAEVLQPQAGERRLGHNVNLGYFAQHQIEALDPSNRVIEELSRAIPPHTNLKARDLLGRFLFSGDDVDKPVSVLSGGERTRLALAKLLVSPVNLLCLDEPTNHLDMTSRDALEDALTEYQGAIVLITHDRHLIRNVANRILEVIDGEVTSFEGDYEFYLYRRGVEGGSSKASKASAVRSPLLDKEQEAPVASTSPSANGAKGKSTQRDRRREGAQARATERERRRTIDRIEGELERVHARKRELESALSDPAMWARKDGASGDVREYEAASKRIAVLEAEWERLTDALG
jgi:ATP-binding cassette subfamily F protein 3